MPETRETFDDLPILRELHADLARACRMQASRHRVAVPTLLRRARLWRLVTGTRLWRRVATRVVLVPVALLASAAIAVAATGVVSVPSMLGLAQQNLNDSPLALFQKSGPWQGGTMERGKDGKMTLVPFKETVIPPSVRMIATPTVPGVGAVQFWAADTEQHGYCVALRLPDGSWAGLKDFKQVGGSFPGGCRPTRAQVGAGALILSGFDYTDAEVLTNSGQELVLLYGQIVAPGDPTEVRDDASGATSPVIDGKYFMLITYPVHDKDGGTSIADDTHLVALNAAGNVIADEHQPLPGTPGYNAPQ